MYIVAECIFVLLTNEYRRVVKMCTMHNYTALYIRVYTAPLQALYIYIYVHTLKSGIKKLLT